MNKKKVLIIVNLVLCITIIGLNGLNSIVFLFPLILSTILLYVSRITKDIFVRISSIFFLLLFCIIGVGYTMLIITFVFSEGSSGSYAGIIIFFAYCCYVPVLLYSLFCFAILKQDFQELKNDWKRRK